MKKRNNSIEQILMEYKKNMPYPDRDCWPEVKKAVRDDDILSTMCGCDIVAADGTVACGGTDPDVD